MNYKRATKATVRENLCAPRKTSDRIQVDLGGSYTTRVSERGAYIISTRSSLSKQPVIILLAIGQWRELKVMDFVYASLLLDSLFVRR